MCAHIVHVARLWLDVAVFVCKNNEHIAVDRCIYDDSLEAASRRRTMEQHMHYAIADALCVE